jgi:N-methylhydantoinase A/oxoprolinase/acetone carboxylase beta subunit
VETFGLGGDTAIHYKDDTPYLEDGRVIPLCILASQYPFVKEELKALDESGVIYTRWLHEYFVLQRPLTGKEGYNDEQIAICKALENGPLSTKKLSKSIGVEVYNLDTSLLEKDGVIMRCGLTPTDIMHIKGDYVTYDKEASLYAANFVARCVGRETKDFTDWAYQEVKHRMYIHLAEILLKRQFPTLEKEGIGSQLKLLIERNWSRAWEEDQQAEVYFPFTVPGVFIGVGGPIGIFLPDVAKAFKSRAIIPKHAEVANAVGAVISRVSFEISVKVHVCYNSVGIDHYVVYSLGENKRFEVDEKKEACNYAQEKVLEDAKEEAKRRGMVEEELGITTFDYTDYFSMGKKVDDMVYVASVTQAV